MLSREKRDRLFLAMTILIGQIAFPRKAAQAVPLIDDINLADCFSRSLGIAMTTKSSNDYNNWADCFLLRSSQSQSQ